VSGTDDASCLARLDRENAKLRKINRVLMERVERNMDYQGNAFSLFQAAIALEGKVQERTAALEAVLHELEAANDAAEAARRFLREAIESISEGFLLCDAQDRLVLSNSKFRDMWPELDPCVDPGTPFDAITRRVATSGAVVDARADPDGWVRRRMQAHRAPGELLVVQRPNDRWLQISERRTRDGGTVSLYTDITEIKVSAERHRERELAEKSVLLQATLDNLAQGVSVLDGAGCLVVWNQRFVELLDVDAALVQAGGPIGHLLDFDSVRSGLMPTDGEDASRPLITEHRTAAGRVLEIRRNPMPGDGFVATYTDITEQRRAAEQLREAKETLERRVEERTRELRIVNDDLRRAKGEAEEANLSKTRFLAAAGHDLLQPLSAARVFASTLGERRMAPANRGLVQHTLAALTSVDEIIAALLDISKLDAGVQPVTLADFRLSDMFAVLAAEYALVASRKGLRLRFVPCSLAVRSDPHLLGRILRNFLSNAIRYTRSGGRILVGCRRRGEAVLLGVWDTGAGVPGDKFEEIFEEFRRLHDTTERGESGMGLGLAIVQRIARTLGHPLTVASQLGRGSLFGVQVPVAATLPMAAARRPASSPSAAVSGLDGARVLILDHGAPMLQAVTALLDHWGCQTIAGLEALGRLPTDARAPHLIIASHHPGGGESGLEAILSLRDRLEACIPAVVIAAAHSDALQARVQQAGCHMLTEPVRRGKLRSLMTHLLRDRAGA